MSIPRTGRVAMFLASAFAATAQPAAPNPPPLSCISLERLGCGCSIRLAGQSCPNPAFSGQPHLFSELEADAPLWLVIEGREQRLSHARHIGSANKGDSPGRFTDIYTSPTLQVRIDYRPADSTCPKDKIDGCEYTDIKAKVMLKWLDGHILNLQGLGICGC